MDDLISRQAAIVSVRKAKDKSEAHRMLIQMPSVQPERKTGKWLIRYFGDSGKCSVCGMYCGEYDLEDSDRYCRCCGAKMEGIKRVKDNA